MYFQGVKKDWPSLFHIFIKCSEKPTFYFEGLSCTSVVLFIMYVLFIGGIL